MKTILRLWWTILILWSASPAQGQTLNWGSEVFGSFVDSDGQALDDSFIFEIGTFAAGFDPDAGNTADWIGNWRVFDRAEFNPSLGYFTSAVNMLDDGTSDSPFMTPGATGFEGLVAYLWVRNSNDPVPGTEWFLGRAGSWIFPAAIPGCCDDGPPLEWSLSDLNGSDTPEWGKQGGVNGGGEFTYSGSEQLQTHTFVPEPSSFMLALLGCGLLWIRRRAA